MLSLFATFFFDAKLGNFSEKKAVIEKPHHLRRQNKHQVPCFNFFFFLSVGDQHQGAFSGGRWDASQRAAPKHRQSEPQV